MTTSYLRIEAVNIANFIEDTEQLSTIRGGGLLLLEAIRGFKKKFIAEHPEYTLKEISTGASVGLFKLTADKSKDIRKLIDEFIRKDSRFCYATFVVDIIAADDENFRNQLEKVIARNRWRQYQQPTLISPQWNKEPDITECYFDRLRPATKDIEIRRDKVSLPVKTRHDYGRDQKHGFCKKELKHCLEKEITDKFTHDLEKLTTNISCKTLQHKMAVIYADGNSFGKLQQKFCKTQKTQKEFDDYLGKKRAEFLSDLLDIARKDDNFSITDDKPKKLLQIETLMWGGDELLLAVPAWQGWRTLALLYKHIKTWEFKETPLYHGAGIVFCHHNAPIHRITKLAKELAERAKDRDRTKNLFQYCVLESFDYISQNLDHYRQDQFPGDLAAVPFSLDAEQIAIIQEPFKQLKETFPRRKAHSLARAAVIDGRNGNNILFAKEEKRTREVVEQAGLKAADILAKKQFFNNAISDDKWPPGMWIHICELWDYICPPGNNGGAI